MKTFDPPELPGGFVATSYINDDIAKAYEELYGSGYSVESFPGNVMDKGMKAATPELGPQKREKIKDMEACSGTAAYAQNENDDAVTHTTKHRSREQILHLKAFFAVTPKPTEKEREEIAGALKMDPKKVKHWFQNTRSQVKKKSEQETYRNLRFENQMLKAENLACREAFTKLACCKCGNPCGSNPKLVLQENIRLRNEIMRVQNLYSHIDPSALNMNTNLPQPNYGEQDHQFFYQ